MSISSLGIDAFIAVAQYGTVQAAADSIGLTATGVTQRIRSLEREMKTTLFVRSRRGMALTQEGRILQRYCNQRSNLEAQALADISKVAVDLPVKITVSGPTYPLLNFVIDNSGEVVEQFRNIIYNFEIDHSKNLTEKLRGGQTDIVIVPKESVNADLESKTLPSTHYYFVCSRKWEGRSIKEILMNEKEVVYAREDQFIDLFLHNFGLYQFQRKDERVIVNNEIIVADIVSKGFGYMILDSKYADRFIKQGKMINLLPDKVFSINWIAVWFRRFDAPEWFKAVTDNIF
jgi:LysR family transcriptional regulator (chromosome initiation inhibitor)